MLHSPTLYPLQRGKFIWLAESPLVQTPKVSGALVQTSAPLCWLPRFLQCHFSLVPRAVWESINLEDKYKSIRGAPKPSKVSPCGTLASQESLQPSSKTGCGRSSECILALRAPAQHQCAPLGFWSFPLEPWAGKTAPNQKDTSVQLLHSLAKHSDTRQNWINNNTIIIFLLLLSGRRSTTGIWSTFLFIGMAAGVYKAGWVDWRKPGLPLLLAQYQIRCLRKGTRRQDNRLGRCASSKWCTATPKK